MKKSYLALLAVMVLASGCVIIDPGHDWSAAERVDIEPFSTLTLTGGFGDVEVWVCDCEAAVYSPDGVGVNVSSGGHLGLDSGDPIVWGSGGDLRLRTPSLERVMLNGSGDVRVHGVFAREFSATNTGSGSIEVDGDARSVDLHLTGSGSIRADDLQAKLASATNLGSGDIELCAFRRVTATVAGSGDIEISCGPDEIDGVATGSGEIEER